MGISRNRLIGSIGVAALVAGALVVTPTAANGLAPAVDLTFLNINDFHGRIDANTVKFAGTVEQLRAAAPGPVAFLSAGDNISASLFASAVADDQPTIDVLNALDLDASAVGNHEFDKGVDDLTNRVIGADPLNPNADWKYLGANVYAKGTQTPVLPEYQILDMGGIAVGVIGAVTQETPSLVSPGGITTIDVGDPVAAVNRVATQLQDGDPANGEADVLIAEYHEGASEGTPDGATFEEELAAGGAFASIVNETSPLVSAIFTGHTHKEYAWDAPVPGDPGKSRPLLQTGSYGANVGQIVLSVDPDSKAVTSYTVGNVVRTTADDATLVATYPRVAEVKSIVDAALANAAEVGNQPVGSVTADITTAYSGGSYVDGTYIGPPPVDPQHPDPNLGRDDRSKESTLGNLVADSLVSSLAPAERGGATIGVVNPGGLRSELFYAGADPATQPANGDGVITYAEANSVLPFVNNLWTVTLSGAQFKTLLEQQWQRDAAGNIPTRPYLQLGLSKNVSYTFDPALPEGSRITSVTVDGQPIDPAGAYRVGTFSFLTTGGDNFRIFTDGTDARDSGLIDRDAWISYLQENPAQAPDFARHAVAISGLPSAVNAGDPVSFTVSGLDLTSLGSPANTSLAVRLDGQDLAPVAVTDGAAQVSFTLPAGISGPHALTLVATPSGTTVTVPLVVTDPDAVDAIDLSASANGQIYGSPDTVTLKAVATTAAGDAAEGSIEFRTGGTVLGSAPLVGGIATLRLPASTPAGVYSVIAAPAGTQSQVISNPIEVTVDKATSQAILLATKTSYRQHAFLPAILIAGVALNNGQQPAGTLDFVSNGTVVHTVQLSRGLAFYILPRSLGQGTYRLQAVFTPTDSANITGVASNFIDIQVR